jgi:hypothetical protein
MDKRITPKLRVIGNPQDIAKFETLIAKYDNFNSYSEPEAREILQEIIDNPINRLRQLSILYDGNSVWSKIKLANAVKRIIKTQDMNNMTDYLYSFLILSCGSIAHYNKQGWICIYPTIYNFKAFFRSNEFGEKVINSIPYRMTDAISAVKEIERLLKI